MPTIDEWLNSRRNDTSIPGGMTNAQKGISTTQTVPATNSGTSVLRQAYDSRNAATSTDRPATGYGGGDYNNSSADYAYRQGIQDNENRISSDPNYKASEIQRALSVRDARKAGNLDTADQNSYLAKLGYADPVAAAVTPATPTGGGSQPSNNSPSLINDIYNNNYAAQAQKLKAARDMALAGLAGQDNLINQNATSGLNNNDLMANQRMVSLKEAMANAGLSASGDNVSAQVGIGNSQQQGANDINQNRGNLLNQSMAQRNAINNNASADDLALMQQLQGVRGGQLLDDSYKTRQYGLDLAGLMGSFDGQRTLAGVNSDRNFALGEAGLTGQYNGQSTLAGKQSNWNAYKDSVGMTGNLGSGPKADWGQLGGTGGAASYNAVQDAIKNGMSQQQIDNQASQFAKTLGYNYANMNANDKQAWAQIAISQQNANTSKQNADSSAANSNQAALYKQWEATGVAPAGIPGVEKGMPLYDKTGARQDEAFKNKQGQLDAKAFASERDGMVSAIRSNKVNVNDAMTQINQDEKMGVYTPDLAEKLRAVVRVLGGSTKITADPQNNVQLDLGSLYTPNGGGTSVTQSVFGR